VADVAGKGVAAALLMAKFSADARFCALTEPEPAAAVAKLNRLLNEANQTDRFITLVALTLRPAEHKVTVVNAGHPAPLLYRAATRTVEEAMKDDAIGLPLGVVDEFAYKSFEIELRPGDCLLAFSDGVNEAMDVTNRMLHVDGVRAAIEGKDFSAPSLGARVVATVTHHAAGRSPHDDIALVCVGRGK
jgi:serine phosphatase RsbU (regulator of sigma subunit)